MASYREHMLCWYELRKNGFLELADEIKSIGDSLRLNEVMQEYASKDENVDFNYLKNLYANNS